MSKVWIVLGVLILAVLLIGGSLIGTYNSLVTLNEGTDGAWAQVQTVLQRRYDLIPNLVNTVQGFADQEQEILTEVTRLRSQWGEAGTANQQAGLSGQLEGALGRLMVVMENYPQLQSNQNFLALQDELAGTENRVAVERRRYNEAVQAYNTTVQRFPTNLIANVAGFDQRDFFEAVADAEQAPVVEFD
jgi:LemA protein